MLRHVDLCSGIGGFSLGFEWAELSKPVLFCDIEPWSRQILAKHWPDVPIAEDVKELANDPDGLVPDCDIITAGYPCQPFSLAGQRRGTEDDRHIWPFIFSIIQAKRPSFCVFENVLGHVTLGLDEVLSDLERESYATRPFVIPACATDAPHRRDRIFIICRNVGDTKHDGSPTPTVKRSIGEASKHNMQGQNKTSQSERASEPRNSGSVGKSARISDVADTNNEGIRPRIRRSSSKSIKEGARRHDHDEGSRANDRFADAGKPQDLQEDVADTQSTRRKPSRTSRKMGDAKKKERGTRDQSDVFVKTSNSSVADTQSMYSKVSGKHTEQGQRQVSELGDVSSKINTARSNWWKPEPSVGRVAHGIPYWVDEPGDIPRVSTGVPNRTQRLRGLGNAIVPQIAMRIGQTIKATYDA